MISLSSILASVSALLALFSSFYVFHRLLVSPALLHFTLFVGAILTFALSAVSVLCSISDICLTPWIIYSYIIISALLTILSCYVILHVGTNFYRSYDIVRNTLLFTP